MRPVVTLNAYLIQNFVGKNDQVHLLTSDVQKYTFPKYVHFREISLKFDIFDNICSVKSQTSKSSDRLCRYV